jgi:hypothetical protein
MEQFEKILTSSLNDLFDIQIALMKEMLHDIPNCMEASIQQWFDTLISFEIHRIKEGYNADKPFIESSNIFQLSYITATNILRCEETLKKYSLETGWNLREYAIQLTKLVCQKKMEIIKKETFINIKENHYILYWAKYWNK